MTINLTAPQARVTDEELYHLIWGLQREGFHARTLAALVELRELRKVNAEKLNQPVSNTYKLPSQSSNDVNDAVWKLHDMLTEHGPLNGYQFNNLKECFYESLKVAMRNSPVTPDGWKSEAEKLAEAYGAAFVIFRHGEEPVCADPTKFWFGFDPAAPKEVK